MIIDSSATELLEKFQSANEAEGVAIKELHAYLQGSVKDKAVLRELTKHMEDAHNKKMDIWDALQEFRLDK